MHFKHSLLSEPSIAKGGVGKGRDEGRINILEHAE
jgi:hypothetical protein